MQVLTKKEKRSCRRPIGGFLPIIVLKVLIFH